MRHDRRRCSTGSPHVKKRQVWAATGVCFLAKPVMARDCGCGALREKMTPLQTSMCTATDYPVADWLMYPLTESRKVAILQSCPGPALTTCSLTG
jgi:hypothetical protein